MLCIILNNFLVIYIVLLFLSLGKHVKPFTPEKAKEIIMCLQQPAVFYNMVFDWPAQHWTAKHLSEVLHGKQIRFRMGTKSTDTGRATRIIIVISLHNIPMSQPWFLYLWRIFYF